VGQGSNFPDNEIDLLSGIIPVWPDQITVKINRITHKGVIYPCQIYIMAREDHPNAPVDFISGYLVVRRHISSLLIFNTANSRLLSRTGLPDKGYLSFPTPIGNPGKIILNKIAPDYFTLHKIRDTRPFNTTGPDYF
jgi:hypothetical protein